MKGLIAAIMGMGVLFMVMLSGTAVAQVQDDNWSEPYRLSSDIGSVIGAGGRLIADDYGYVHAFWAEDGFSDLRIIVQYARFDGERWSEPVDIFLSAPDSTFGFLSDPVIDKNGYIHLIWTMSQTGPIFYFKAPITGATSARNWMRQASIEVPSNRAELMVDEFGMVHIVYSNLEGKEPGVYYIRSQDEGISWTQPYWIDPDIPLDYSPARVIFKRDEVTGWLHILWKYDEVIDEVGVGKDIRHVYSFNHGDTWSSPFIIDEADEEFDELRAGGMVFAVNNNQVHVVWAGTSTTRREHRFSLDGGKSWSETYRVFGELNGSAGDSLVFDGAGRLHFFGQIRFPQGMWNISWDGESWSNPSLVYLIRKTSEDEHEGIHIHAINGIMRGTKQLVVSFTNSPSEDQLFLYVMHRSLDDIEQREFVNWPTPTPTPQPTPTVARNENVEPTPFPSQPFNLNATFEAESPADGLWASLIPSISLVGVVVMFGFVMRRRAK
jgi:hypothetical protein